MLNSAIKQYSKAKTQGFTLIELLVVVAIIALLAAILFPVFGRARENARRSTCQSNLKQIGLGILQYSQDYDERFPSAYSYEYSATRWPTTYGRPVPNSWDRAIMPYMGVKVNNHASDYSSNATIFRCPSDTAPLSATMISYYGSGAKPRSYSMTDSNYGNDGFVGPSKDDGYGLYAQGRHIGVFADPSGTLMVTENTNGQNIYGSFNGASCVGWALSRSMHFEGGLNYLFVDGHVKWLNNKTSSNNSTDPEKPKGMWTRYVGD